MKAKGERKGDLVYWRTHMQNSLKFFADVSICLLDASKEKCTYVRTYLPVTDNDNEASNVKSIDAA